MQKAESWKIFRETNLHFDAIYHWKLVSRNFRDKNCENSTLRPTLNLFLTLDNLDTAKDTQPLYSSGFFFTRASIRDVAAVTTPICWSFSRWMILEVHSPLGIIFGSVRNNLNKHRAADCLTTSRVSLKKDKKYVKVA